MKRQASLMCLELEDCWSDNQLSPVRTSSTTRRPSNSTVAEEQLQESCSNVSLKSCNSTETLKQWTMQYPVTTCCQPACKRKRRRRKRQRRRHSCDDDCSDGEETDVVNIYTDCNGKVCFQRKPCTTTKKRLANQSKNAASFLISDSDSSDDRRVRQMNADDVDVNDNCPTRVDLMSCDSSFSDCSLPCHELVTYSEGCQPLPEGLVKVSIRPPQCVEPCELCGPCGPCLCVPCTDRDRYDIKFVSHLVDRPDTAKVCKVTPVFEPPPLSWHRDPSLPPPPRDPSLPPPPRPPSVKVISPIPSPVVVAVSEETISSATIISEPPSVVEEIPSPPPPPSPPTVSSPIIVEPWVYGVTGTQVVTRSRKHYGDICKLIRCSKPPQRCCQPCPRPCELPAPCNCYPPCEPCNYPLTCGSVNNSNSCSSYPSCRSSPSYCDEEDSPCNQFEQCPPSCCQPPPIPCCRPCCKVTWLRSVTTKPVKFANGLIMKNLKSLVVCDPCGCGCVRSSSQVFSDSQLQQQSVTEFTESAAYDEDENENENENENESQSNANVNVNAITKQSSNKCHCQSPDVGARAQKAYSCCPIKRAKKPCCKVVKEIKSVYQEDCCAKCPCKPFANPWKRPPGMEQQTFERYVKEIVCTLAPVIPPNPFAVPREKPPCSNNEPDCERIRVELESLLAAVDDFPGAAYSCTTSSADAVRSGWWHC